MPLIWNDSLLTGINVVDTQHRELFRKINELLDSAGRSKEKILEIVKFLQNYIVNHFGTEERLMLKTNYPAYTSHKNALEKYFQDFKGLKESMEKEGINVKLTVEMNRLLVDWWINHIINRGCQDICVNSQVSYYRYPPILWGCQDICVNSQVSYYRYPPILSSN